ncbi:hypothetical protein FOQG_04747 [Fusarium oxysporum f. sp. raphani 54005]|uniref:DUF8035 domain-containing protein n=2 Tax=Fusarium oxysporum f. sp. raphani TaxID=96318 RepID=X0CGA5_FUSOX|nr:hypothetical protein FOQG_04747 [Fusarium oxysporum f. sp. raphani 54005]KAG7438714.1 hypothetical protein Forpi1262_v001806 [Fusarium oxysporum f. sp. raphani]KAJ4031771.1 hypothetical protein NW758_012060 [Fusarium oxysporum]KAJ4075821.1 hypothetical protein NW761_013083 [Fusarium oxysporum]
MTTVERWQGQLPSRLGGGEGTGSSTQVSAQGSHDVECPEGLRHKLSNWRASVSFRPPPSITSKSAQQVDPKAPQYDGSDSGIGIAAPSSHSQQSEPVGLDLPGTELKSFDEPISQRLKARFFDIKVLYTQPLLDYILKRKKDPGDISMKLKHLGLNSQSIQLHIVIQCERKVARRVRKFFAQGHVEEELLPDFRVFVLEKALLRLTDDEAIEVLTDSVPKRTWCGTPIRLMRGNVSVVATFGGIIVVETSHKRLVGLTAAHSLKKLHSPLSNQLLTNDTEVPFSSSSSNASESESDSDCESTITTESSVQHLEHLNDKGLDTTASQSTVQIGTILCNTFNAPMAQNYDWAIIDLSQQATLPNRVVLDGQPDSSDFEEDSDLEPILFPVGNPCVSVSRQVLVLKQGAKPIGEMSLDTSSVLISPGSSFVEVYDLAMEHGSSLSPGDSGSWVVDAKTSVLYGHVVSTDAFGEAQVMPIRSTLDSIKVQMNATRVFLPNSDEIQLLRETSRIPVPANLEASPITVAPEQQEITQATHSEDMTGDQFWHSPPSTEASDKFSAGRAVSQQDIVAQSLDIARESPDGASYPSIRQILESALEEIWTKVQDQPDSYVMTRDEFAVFSFFQHRFTGDKMAVAARKRYWGSLSIDSPESTKTESGDLGQIDAIRKLVQASYRRIGTYGPDFANVATKLYKLELALRRFRDDVAQEDIPVHLEEYYYSHLHSLIEDWDFAMKRVSSLIDTYNDEEISFEGEDASVRSELKPIEPILAGKRMAIELLLDSVQLQKPQIDDGRESDLEYIKDKVDQIAAQLFANRDAGSFSGEDDDLWRHFQELLEKEGFSSQVLSKSKDVLVVYINELRHVANTMTSTLPRTHIPSEPPLKIVPNEQPKPDIKHKLDDAKIQWEVITTEDIIALDREDSVMQQIQPLLSPREAGPLQQPIASQDWYTETSRVTEDLSRHVSSQSTYRGDNGQAGFAPNSQLVAPDQDGRAIPDDAHWTKISRKLVSVEVLQRAGVRYEARPDYVAILGVLSREKVAKLVRDSEVTITSRPPPPYRRARSTSGQARLVSPVANDDEVSFIPLVDGDNVGSSLAEFLFKRPSKALDNDVTADREERYPSRSAEKKQEKPGSKQEKFNGRQRHRSRRRSIYEPRREINDWGRLQHDVRAYDKGGPGGVVGIGSAAVSLLCVLSEAASAI